MLCNKLTGDVTIINAATNYQVIPAATIENCFIVGQLTLINGSTTAAAQFIFTTNGGVVIGRFDLQPLTTQMVGFPGTRFSHAWGDLDVQSTVGGSACLVNGTYGYLPDFVQPA